VPGSHPPPLAPPPPPQSTLGCADGGRPPHVPPFRTDATAPPSPFPFPLTSGESLLLTATSRG